jgi:Ser/Thr protein kinase RdoA (MazF antagonist)
MSSRPLSPGAALKAVGQPAAAVGDPLHGFSGATVWPVSTPDGRLALKAYPPDWGDVSKLRVTHTRLRQARDWLPAPVAAPWEDQGRAWDLVTWVAGQPVGPQHARAAGAALAHMHAAWHADKRIAPTCPSVLRYWQALAEQTGRCPSYPDVERLYRELAGRALSRLQGWLCRETTVQPIHGDAWPGNLLAFGDRNLSFIDHGSIRVDSAMADLARLAELDQAEVVAGYDAARPLSLIEADLLATLRETGPVVRLGTWLAWLAAGREFPNPAAATARFLAVVAAARALA